MNVILKDLWPFILRGRSDPGRFHASYLRCQAVRVRFNKLWEPAKICLGAKGFHYVFLFE